MAIPLPDIKSCSNYNVQKQMLWFYLRLGSLMKESLCVCGHRHKVCYIKSLLRKTKTKKHIYFCSVAVLYMICIVIFQMTSV